MDSNLLVLIPYILTCLAAVIALFFKNKADKAASQAEINKVKAEDVPLAAKQSQIEDKIKAVENEDDSKLTPEERASRWKN